MVIFVAVETQTTLGATTSKKEQYEQLQSLLLQLQGISKTVAPQHQATSTAEWKFNYSASTIRLGLHKEEASYEDSELLNRYKVRNNRLYGDEKWQKDDRVDNYKIWNIFASIAGDDFVTKYMRYYVTYKNKDSGTLAFVKATDTSGQEWGLAINANASDFGSKKWTRDLVTVLLHEYAHILTLNNTQVDHKKIKSFSCKRFLGSQGCSEKKSYIQSFATKFWTDPKWFVHSNFTKRYAANKNQFVTEYAAKNPEEDMAESFTQFILYEKPTGTLIKDQKVLFFYQYPNLVELRTQIRSEIKEYFVKI